MDLVLDLGNTRLKAAVFDGRDMVWQGWAAHDLQPFLLGVLDQYEPQHALLCATGAVPDWLEGLLKVRLHLFWLNEQAPLPFINAYATPSTLGRDRLAALAGTVALGFDGPLLVIDAGTCVTCDLLEPGRIFRQGSIAPGIRMRLRAMHQQTHRLPDIEPNESVALAGGDTASAMRAGAQMGLICELEGRIARYREDFPNLQVVITGGDQEFLVRNLKCVIFAHAELVLSGLNHILKELSDAG